MTYFIKSGNNYKTTNEANLNIEKKLPPGTYIVRAALMEGFYLEPTDSLRQAGKIYGSASRNVDRILNTFNERPVNTGVILEGEKGAGKTMLARLLSQALEFAGHPTLIINSGFAGDGFNAFIQSITQPCMLFFDEFEKVYKTEDQNALLTLFDGTFASKKLIVVALNDNLRIVDFFKNRPGRFFYRFTYKGLEEDFIREYLQDKLNNKDHIKPFMTFCNIFGDKFNFDMMQALVEEMNRYNEPIGVVARYVNAKPVIISQRLKLEKVIVDGRALELKKYTVTMPNPIDITGRWSLLLAENLTKEETKKSEEDINFEVDKDYHYCTIENSDLQKISRREYFFSLEKDHKKYEITLSKPEAEHDPYEGLYSL